MNAASGTICPPASATGSVPGRYNRVDLLSLTPAFRNVLNSPLLSLGSTPSALSDFAQMFKEKEFFFFKRMSKAWQNTVQRNAKVSTVLKRWLLAHFLLAPASPFPRGGGKHGNNHTCPRSKNNPEHGQVIGSQVISLCSFMPNFEELLDLWVCNLGELC